MTIEEAKTVFLNRGYVEVEGGTIYDADKWREACIVISEWLEQQPCEDAISRQEAIDANCYNCSIKANGGKCSKCDAVKAIENLSSVKPQEKTGHWITTRTFMHDGEFYCDKCKCDSPNNEKWDYCPNCGAKMVMAESEGI